MGLVFGVFVNPVDSRRHRLCHWSVGGGAVMEKLNCKNQAVHVRRGLITMIPLK